MRIELTSMKDVQDFLSLFKSGADSQKILEAVTPTPKADSRSEFVIEEPKTEPEPAAEPEQAEKETEKSKPRTRPQTPKNDVELSLKQQCRMLIRQCVANNMRDKALQCMSKLGIESVSAANDSQLERLKELLDEEVLN